MPIIFGVADTYGIELIHPICEGRSPQQVRHKGLSNRRYRWLLRMVAVFSPRLPHTHGGFVAHATVAGELGQRR